MLVAHAAWSAPISVDVPAVLALLLFFHGWLRLRRRGRPDLADGKRAALFTAGLLVVLGGLLTPIHSIGERHLLWVHMLQHVMIGDLGIALMVTAVRGPLLVFMLPARVLGPIARDRDVRAILSFLLRPKVAFGLWAANLAIWHIPSLYIDAVLHPQLHDLEHACWMLAGLLVFASVLLVSNTIRLSLFSRRREVEVMKLVGATDWFIRWPFVLEGLFLGALGGAAAIGLLALAKLTLIDPLASTVKLISQPDMIDFRLLIVVLMGCAIAVSAAGSGISLRRFLRV